MKRKIRCAGALVALLLTVSTAHGTGQTPTTDHPSPATLTWQAMVARDTDLQKQIDENTKLMNDLSPMGESEFVSSLIDENRAIEMEQLRNAEAFVKQYPDNAKGHNFLGLIYYSMARPDDALREWKKAVELNPDFAEAHNNLGTYYSHFGEPLQAAACFEKALKIGPPKPVYYFNLSLIYFTSRDEIAKMHGWPLTKVFQQCQNLLLKARDLSPDKYKYQREYAMNFYIAKYFGLPDQKDNAIKAWKKCAELAKTPDQEMEVDTHLGRIYFQKRDRKRAIEHLQRAIELGATMPATHLLKRARKELRPTSITGDAQ